MIATLYLFWILQIEKYRPAFEDVEQTDQAIKPSIMCIFFRMDYGVQRRSFNDNDRFC